MTIHFRQLAAKRNTTHLFIDDWKINTQQSWGYSARMEILALCLETLFVMKCHQIVGKLS